MKKLALIIAVLWIACAAAPALSQEADIWSQALLRIEGSILDVAAMEDGGYLLAGFLDHLTRGEPGFSRKAAVWRVDASGRLLWQTLLGDGLTEDMASSPHILKSGEIAFYYIRAGENERLHDIILLGADGSQQAKYALPAWVTSLSRVENIFYFWGYQPHLDKTLEEDGIDYQVSLGAMDISGGIQWVTRDFALHAGIFGELTPYIAAPLDGDILLAGLGIDQQEEHGFPRGPFGFVARMDNKGNLQWLHKTEGEDHFHALAVTEDGDIVAAGTRYLSGMQKPKGILTQCGPDGALQWLQTFSLGAGASGPARLEEATLTFLTALGNGYLLGVNVYNPQAQSAPFIATHLLTADSQGNLTGEGIRLPGFQLHGFLRQADGGLLLYGNLVQEKAGVLLPLSACLPAM